MKLQGALLILGFVLLAKCSTANTNTNEIGDALIRAAENGNLEIVKHLMETGMKDERLIEGLSGGIGDALIQAANNGTFRGSKVLDEDRNEGMRD